MKVCVLGMWHLGSVIAACLASGGHDVVGLDFDEAAIAGLASGTPPVFEPGLEALVKAGLANGRLCFSTDAESAVRQADVLWIAYDTPVDENDRADVEYVVARAARVLPHLPDDTLVLISSQVPVGTTRRLEQMCASAAGDRHIAFAYSPENLRLGTAIQVFTNPDRVVVGTRADADREKAARLLKPLTDRIEWMSVESAEMTKHALNAFLAMSVAFINEIAAVCEQVGVDASDVARGLKSESRIGPRAYLSPGAAFAGGTLARDVVSLTELGCTHGIPTHLLTAVKASNDAHAGWTQRSLLRSLGTVSGKTVAVWGLAYKPGTDTLRRSSAVELCRWLLEGGATVRAHDPAVKSLPAALADHVRLTADPLEAVAGASALVVATPWPEYRDVAPELATARMTRRLVLDASRFLDGTFGRQADTEYVSVGRATA